MNGRPMLVPDASHPISIEHSRDHIVIKAAGRVIVDTQRALTLREATYPPVFYIPREDADMSALAATERHTYCPYKGDCSYFSIPAGGDKSVNAIWTYEAPYDAVKEIRGHLAFYPSRVDSIEVAPAL